MPARQSVWKRETSCLVCQHRMINYQPMARSQAIEYDDWLLGHSRGLKDYEDFPATLKTTICPNCLVASNEFSFGVDSYKYFDRRAKKHERVVDMYRGCLTGRFKLLAREFEALEEECAIYDRKRGKPANMRSRATLEKIWSDRERYAEPFLAMLFAEPRDYPTALVCFAMDRHCQLLRIAYEYGILHDPDDPDDLYRETKEFFGHRREDLRTSQTRLFLVASNYHQSAHLVERMEHELSRVGCDRYGQLKTRYRREAFDFFRYSEANEDMTAIPLEFKEGGMAYLLCRFHLEAGDGDEARKWIRLAKRYADSKLRRIVNSNQQNFVNWVDDLYRQIFEQSH